MPDRRRLKRRHLVVYPKVTDKRNGETLGRIGDISQDGLLLLTQRDIPLGTVFEVDIELPEDVAINPDNHLWAKIRTTWSEPDKNPSLTCVGSRFIDISTHGRELIEDAIEYYSFRS